MVQVKKIASFTGHRDCVYVLEKSGEQSQFFSASGDGMVVKWDLEDPDKGELVAKVDNSVYALAFVPDKNWLIIGHNFKGLHIIDLTAKKEIKNLHFTDAAIFDVLLAEGQVFVATGDGKVYSFLLDDFSMTNMFHFSDKSARCLAYNYHIGHLAIGYSDCFIRIVKENRLLKEIKAHDNSVFTVIYSPDGTEMLSGGRDARLKVWEVGNGYALKEDIAAHMYAINHLSFNPSGSYYATASMDKSIKIWDMVTHKLLKVIDKSRHAGHGTSVNKLLWTDSEGRLVSCSDDRSISVWNIGL